MKPIPTLIAILLAVNVASAQLFIDFCNQTTPVAAGYQAYRATQETSATFTPQSFTAFGTNITIAPSWEQNSYQYSKQLIDRGTANTPEAADLLRDWIGTDNRVTTGTQPTPGLNPMTLMISNLPAGTYRWLSYHHDPNDQTGLFNAIVNDAKGSRTNLNIDISNGALALSSVTKWITTITSDGVNPVSIRFAQQLTTPTASSFFVMNGFELTFLGVASQWMATGGGNWSESSNWDVAGVPNGSTEFAVFGTSILAPSTISVDVPVTLSALNFSSTQAYTLSGANLITLADNNSGIAVDAGKHSIEVPLTVAGGRGLTIGGAGELTLLGNNTYTGPTVASVPALTINSLANGGSPSAVGASGNDGTNLVFTLLRYIGTGHSSDRFFTFPSGTRTIEASGTGPLTLSNPGEFLLTGTGARTLVLAGTNTGNNTFSPILPNASVGITSLTKNGTGKWVLASANTFTGPVAVNEGTLAASTATSLGAGPLITVRSNAVLDVSAANLTLGFGQVLQGYGSVVGNVTDGTSFINPGASNSAGTLTFSNSLTVAAGGAMIMDLGSATTPGAGVNDLIEVEGNLDLSGATVIVNFTGTNLSGTYRLINYKGSLVGTPNVSVSGLENTRYSAVVDTSVAKQVNLVFSGSPASLVWTGDGADNFWDVTSPNWTNPATSTGFLQYRELDNATFNSIGSSSSNVNLPGIVRPASITVDTTTAYNFGSTGAIGGATTLLKLNSGTLTLSNANTYYGLTTVAGGVLRVGNNTALGTSGGDTIIQNGATLDVFGFQTSSDHIYVTGSGVGGAGAIINTRAEQQSATRMVTLTGDTLVSSDFRWDVRGAGGSGSFSGIFDLAGFTFTRIGTNRIAIVDSMATNAGNIVMVQGGMSLTRSMVEGPGYIDVGTNFVWIENSPTGVVSKPLIFNGGTLQCSGNDFLLHSFITNTSGMTIDAANTLTVSNVISGAGSVTKIGSGTVVLEAANTYAGDTTIQAGTLRLGTNGTIGGGSAITMATGSTFDVLSQTGFTVASGKTMTAAGTVNGSLTLAGNSTLQVGSVTNTGTLTIINGTVSLNSSTLMKLNATAKTNDVIATTNSISLGGTLEVSVLTGTLAAGDTYKLFNAPVLSGTFTSVTLPPLGPGQIWINKLTTDGTIRVGELVLDVTLIPGGFMQFTWDPVLNGLVKLQAQTNTLDVGLSNNWADYPGGSFNGIVHVPSTSSPTVFFRLISQ